MKRIGPLGVVVLVLTYLPFVALAILGGVILGWRVVIAAMIVIGLYMVYYRRASRPPRRVTRARAAAEFVLFTLAGGVVGGVAFGPLGVIFGLALGFTARLAEVPVTRRT